MLLFAHAQYIISVMVVLVVFLVY